MGHTSMNEELKGLDVNQEFECAKLYQQAIADAAFLRNLSMKQDSDAVPVRVPFRSSSVGHQEYALYRQKYLVMYSPFRTFGKKEDKKSMTMKEKINKLFIVNFKKENTKTTEPKSNKDKLSSAGFLESVLRFLRFLRWANGDESGKAL